jgi:hypothetical protein
MIYVLISCFSFVSSSIFSAGLFSSSGEGIFVFDPVLEAHLTSPPVDDSSLSSVSSIEPVSHFAMTSTVFMSFPVLSA